MDRKLLGAHGEELATEFLVGKGFVLIGRNLRLKPGEIDILMREGETLVLVEVKTVARAGAIDPIYKISSAKQRKLWQLARVLNAQYPERNVRIDAVTLYWKAHQPDPLITHYPNILSH